MQFREVLKSKV